MTTAYVQGHEAACARYKVASYLTEEDMLERKMQRHMAADPEAEKQRLMDKGRAQGSDAGKAFGTAGGAIAGGGLGALLGSLARSPGVGSVVGGLAGAIGGGALGRYAGGRHGGNVGEESGKAEFGHREEYANQLKDLSPSEQRRRIERYFTAQRAQDAYDMQQLLVDSAHRGEARDYMRDYDDRHPLYRGY